MIKAIIFDVGGVLAISEEAEKAVRGHHSLGVHEYVAYKLGIDLDTWFDAIDTPYVASIEGKLNKQEVVDVIAKNLNVSGRRLERLLIKAYRKHFKRNGKLYNFAFRLKKGGYRIAILSDQWPVSKEAVMRAKDNRKFDLVVVSCEVGMRKPQLKVYNYTLNKLGLKGDECVFIDNREWNLISARKVGIKTILYRNNNQVVKDLEKIGVVMR